MNATLRAVAAAALPWLLLSCAGTGTAPTGDAGRAAERPRRVVLATVGGLRAEHLRVEPGREPALPTLVGLARSGVVADGMRSIGSPLAYPAHANLVTGNAPDRHGVVADRLLGKRGVRNALFWHATRVKGPSLWQQLRAAGRSVAAIGWPSTVGAPIDLIVPDLVPLRPGETWLGVLQGAATPSLLEAMRDALPAPPDPWPGAAQRDRALVAAACAAMRAPRDPVLVLLRLSEPAEQMRRHGPAAPEVDAALRRIDALVARLRACAGEDAALAVAGGPALAPVHTRIDANVALASAGLLLRGQVEQVTRWRALVRATATTATVHAVDQEAALEARRLLDGLAQRTGAFRVIAATELSARRGDPQAWFGLEAEPGYVFANGVLPPLLRPAEPRAAETLQAERQPAFVAAGPGLRAGVRVPAMTQLDVAPTLAQLVGIPFEGAEGRVLIGTLCGAAALPPAATGLPGEAAQP